MNAPTTLNYFRAQLCEHCANATMHPKNHQGERSCYVADINHSTANCINFHEPITKTANGEQNKANILFSYMVVAHMEVADTTCCGYIICLREDDHIFLRCNECGKQCLFPRLSS